MDTVMVRETLQPARSVDKGMGQDGAEQEGTAWTDEEGEADEEEMEVMRVEYQRDPAAVEAMWAQDAYEELLVEGTEGGSSMSYEGYCSNGW